MRSIFFKIDMSSMSPIFHNFFGPTSLNYFLTIAKFKKLFVQAYVFLLKKYNIYSYR